MGRLDVRVVPRASRDGVFGFDAAGRLRVKLTAPPVEGEANDALIKLLAKKLGIAKSRVSVVRGSASRSKVILVEGMSDAELKSMEWE
jgi:uncharacterized protein (TIGR00251 family)